jgi:hypothetical protein
MKTHEPGLVIGAAFGGGFFAGYIRVGEGLDAVILSPKDPGEKASTIWHKSRKSIPGAQSFFNGRSNTLAMAEAGSELAKWALDLRIGDFADWFLPSRDELELLYRNFKPGKNENYCSFRDGDNPSSVPAGYPYSSTYPAQAAIEAFRAGGAEAFEEDCYVSSTEYAPDPGSAWGQDFTGGYQYCYRKGTAWRARAVRRQSI